MQKTRLKTLLIAALLCVTVLSAFLFVSCGTDSSSTVTDPTYSKKETDEYVISNASFEFGTAELSLDEFPRSSMTGWSVAADNSAYSSAVSSGIVKATDDGWKAVIENLYENDEYLDYALKRFNIEKGEKTKEELVDEIIENFPNPTAQEGSQVLMLNNIRSIENYGVGTAQKATSSTTVTLEKGKYGKLSVWVKTAELQGAGKFGANIRIKGSFNAASQAEYSLFGITDTEWTNYVIYIKADEDYSTSFQVCLGIGYGNGKNSLALDYVEGTAFFDNITFETVDALPYDFEDDITKHMIITSDDALYQERVADIYAYLYDMTSEKSLDALSAVDLTDLTYEITESNTGATSKTVLGEENSDIGSCDFDPLTGEITVSNLKNAASFITIEVNDEDDGFAAYQESYFYLTMKIGANGLGRLNKNGVSVYVCDYYNDIEKLSQITTVNYSDVNEFTRVGIMIKNNFPELDKDNLYVGERTFRIYIFIGPANVTDGSVQSDFASGSVVIKDVKFLKGYTYQYQRTDYVDADDSEIENTHYEGAAHYDYVYQGNEKSETENYKLYSFLNTNATGSVSLFAGKTSEYSDGSSDSFTFSVAPSEVGTIVSAPTTPKDYTGLTAEHAYIDGSNNYAINTRSGNVDGSDHAGLINTKYLDEYENITGLDGIKTALNHSGDKNALPLMIYNSTADHYGYIGKSVSVSASSYASVTVNVKVVGDAKAYVYLVDLGNEEKTVMELSFITNTDGYQYTQSGALIKGSFAFEGITEDMMDDNGENAGWLTLTFYIATGKTAKSFRLEMWNGGRDNAEETASAGYVFFDSVKVTTSSAFTEPTEWESAFVSTDSVLYKASLKDDTIKDNAFRYKRTLDKTEIKFNSEQTDSSKLVSYDANYVWAKNSSTVYGVFNTIDPVAVDPYASEEEETTGGGCQAETDPSTFWLSFSSILLAVVLVFAIVMLIIRNVMKKRKRHATDAQSHYKVKSRITARKSIKEKKIKETDAYDGYEDDESAKPEEDKAETEVKSEPAEEVESAENTQTETAEEPKADEYVYGDVQDFGNEETDAVKEETPNKEGE